MKSTGSALVLFWIIMIWSHAAGSVSQRHALHPVSLGFMTADGKPYNGDITTLPVFSIDPSVTLRTCLDGRALPQTHLDGDPITGDKPAFKGYKILRTSR